METVIRVENVSKKFKLHYDRPISLKERLIRGSKGAYTEFYALKNVSFDIKKGSTVGLIGQNGSGKSTMLKMINRTMFPDTGKISVIGKVSSLIELGAGFHPELSGRENIYTNATIFGFTKEEIDERVPDIIRFSELEDFIDNPIRTYSSGMYARLAFSVAIHVDADILLVDEILGVGDMNFQSKCANKIFEMRKKGTTILMVTHDMSTIDRLCDYAIFLDHGEKLAEGTPKVMEKKYIEFMSNSQEARRKKEGNEEERQEAEFQKKNKVQNNEEEQTKEQEAGVETVDKNRLAINNMGNHFGNGDLIFTTCKLLNDKGIDKRSFYSGEKITLQITYVCQIPPEDIQPNIGFEVSSLSGVYLYGTNTNIEGMNQIKLQKEGTIEVILHDLKLLPGDYSIGIAVEDVQKKGITYDHYHNIAEFKVYSAIHDVGFIRLKHDFFIDGNAIIRKDK